MNNKELFKSWVLNNLSAKSGAGPAYMTSIDWLSNKFYEKSKITKKSIFEIEDIELISKLHAEVLSIQKDKNSFIYNIDAPSYGDSHYFSASLNKYKEFLHFKNGGSVIEKTAKQPIIDNAKFDINSFNESVFESGLIFSEKLISR